MTTPPPPDALAAAGAELARVRALQQTTHPATPYCDDNCPTWLHSFATCTCQPLARIRAEQTAEHDTNGADDGAE